MSEAVKRLIMYDIRYCVIGVYTGYQYFFLSLPVAVSLSADGKHHYAHNKWETMPYFHLTTPRRRSHELTSLFGALTLGASFGFLSIALTLSPSPRTALGTNIRKSSRQRPKRLPPWVASGYNVVAKINDDWNFC